MNDKWKFLGGFQPEDELDLENPPRNVPKPRDKFDLICPFNMNYCGESCALYLRIQKMCAIKSIAMSCTKKM